MWVIDKQFSFCYGHRVWSQLLHTDYCEKNDTKTKCRHKHGHEGLVHVFLESDELERGMVTDFKHLGWLKNFLDDNVDHKFIIDRNDPAFVTITNGTIRPRAASTGLVDAFQPLVDLNALYDLIPVMVPGTNFIAGYIIDVSQIDDPVMVELIEGYFIVDFVPTSENLSKWLYEAVDAKMSLLNIITSRIDWFETPKSRSTYLRPSIVPENYGGA